MPRNRGAPHNLRLPILQNLLHLVLRSPSHSVPSLLHGLLPNPPDGCRRIDMIRILEALQQPQHVREGGGVEVAGAQVDGEVVDRHAEVDRVDLREGLVGRVELHNADLVDEGAGHVVEAVETLDDAVRVVEARRRRHVAGVGRGPAVGEVAAAEEGVEFPALMGSGWLAYSGPIVETRVTYQTDCRTQTVRQLKRSLHMKHRTASLYANDHS